MKDTLLTEEIIKKVETIIKMNKDTSTQNTLPDKAYEVLKTIYPLSSKRKKTDIKVNKDSNYHFIISKSINELYSHYEYNSSEIRTSTWAENVLNTKTYIKLAEFIPTKFKKELFLKIHQCLEGIENNTYFNHVITKEFKDKVYYEYDREVQVIKFKGINYNGNYLNIIVEEDTKHISFDYNISLIELANKYFKEIVEIIDEWNCEKEKITKEDNIKLENAREIVKPLMVMNKIKEM